jgi:hypothetical protein
MLITSSNSASSGARRAEAEGRKGIDLFHDAITSLRSGEREIELHPVSLCNLRAAHQRRPPNANFSAKGAVRQELTAQAAVFLNCRPPLSLVPCAK